MKIFKTQNLKTLWTDLATMLQNHSDLVPKKGGGFNFRGDYYIHLYDILYEVSHCSCPDLFLEELGYSSSGAKTHILLKKYLDPTMTNKWLDFIQECMEGSPDVAGDILLNTKPQGKREMPGGCIVSFIYRGAPLPMLTVISRAIEMPTKGAADMLLVGAICRLLCERLHIKDMRVQWYFSSAWTRTRTSFYWVIYNWPKKIVFANSLFQEYITKGWKKYYLTDFEFSYSANIRAKQLFLNKKSGGIKKECGEQRVFEKLKEYLR